MVSLSLSPVFLDALETLCVRLDGVTWAVTASTNLALRGVPIEPGDIDIVTTESEAYEVEARFADRVTDPVSWSKSTEKRIASHFGALDLDGVRVEIMGDVEHYIDSEWVSTADVAAHREFVAVDSHEIPVMPIEQELAGYRELGRDERAELIETSRGATQ